MITDKNMKKSISEDIKKSIDSCMTIREPIKGQGKAHKLENSNEYVVTEKTTLACTDGKVRMVGKHLIGKIIPEEVFETCIPREEEDNIVGFVLHSFSKALELLEADKAISREGWNGKGMFLYLVPANTYPAQTKIAKEKIGDVVPYGAYIAMKTAQGNVVPWLASQTDVLAKDWILI